MTAVMGAFVTDHTKQTVVFAVQETTKGKTLWEGDLGGVLRRAGSVIPH